MREPAARRFPAVPAVEWLKPVAPGTRFAFYGSAPARAAATSAWGCGFSAEPLRAVAGAGRATLWLGPDEYLLLDTSSGDPATAEASFAALELALEGVPHALVDISHRQFGVNIVGPKATNILNGACPLDLDLSQFPVGMCTRTVFAKADIVLWRTGESVFHVEIWRSFAGYVTGLLEEIAARL